VLYRGRFDRQHLTGLAIDTSRMEGSRLRRAGRLAFAAFGESVVTWVRLGQVVAEADGRQQPVGDNRLANPVDP
jgi:Tfp pilus assembly protein PilP